MDIKDFFKNIGIGSGTNVTKFDENGQPIHEGEATQWDDISGSIAGLKLLSNTGSIDFDWENNEWLFDKSGNIANQADRLIWNVQKFHKVKENSELHYHMHYKQTDEIVRSFKIQFRIQPNGGAYTNTWTDLTTTTAPENLVFPYVSGMLNQIVKFPAIDWSAVGISSTLNFRITRDDTDIQVVAVSFIDGHVEIDSDGSNTEWSK